MARTRYIRPKAIQYLPKLRAEAITRRLQENGGNYRGWAAKTSELIAALHLSPRPKDRIGLLRRIGLDGSAKALSSVSRYVTDVDPRVREAAVDAIFEIALTVHFKLLNKTICINIPTLGGFLLERFDYSEQDELVIPTVALALGVISFQPAIDSLVREAKSSNISVQICCIRGLAMLGAINEIQRLEKLNETILEEKSVEYFLNTYKMRTQDYWPKRHEKKLKSAYVHRKVPREMSEF